MLYDVAIQRNSVEFFLNEGMSYVKLWAEAQEEAEPSSFTKAP